jgi:hypothetical protein
MGDRHLDKLTRTNFCPFWSIGSSTGKDINLLSAPGLDYRFGEEVFHRFHGEKSPRAARRRECDIEYRTDFDPVSNTIDAS